MPTNRAGAVALWAFAAWVGLTWTTSVQQLVAGAIVAVLTGIALAPLGDAVRPWSLFAPRRLWRAIAIVLVCAPRIVKANVGLARRIWDPRLPIRSGMLVFGTDVRTAAGVTSLGLLSSLVVDNQLVDLEAARVQYHAVWAEPTDPEKARRRVFGSLEPLVHEMEQDGR